MIVRTLETAEKTDRRIQCPNGHWESTRMLLQEDEMGFSFHITTIFKGARFDMHYQNHLESVYCISGEGSVQSREDGRHHEIKPGTLYVLDKHDKHTLQADTELTLACVFNPPLIGNEVHNAEGSYSLNAEKVTES